MRYVFAAVTLATIASHVLAEDGYTAKSLFFGEDDTVHAVSTGVAPGASDAAALADNPADPSSSASAKKSHVVKVSHRKIANVGASYFIRLRESDGTTRDVLARRVFKTGEHFQLGIKVNRPSYVYILNEAPDGSIHQIYPQPSQDNFVDAMGVVFFPAHGSFVFDNNPGMEKLMVYLSPERISGNLSKRIGNYIPDLVSSPLVPLAQSCAATTGAQMAAAPASVPSPDAQVQLASTDANYAAKGINFSTDSRTDCAANTAMAPQQDYAAKGIVFSDDSAPASGGQVASYVVKPASAPDAASLYLKINLAHE